ncbi:hypothetical protein [Ectopseudomonas composti]|uniref:hypothetical protein n=1 Tax=Ectopseudomonas composti TaxID=658457 RepID=UPI0012FEED3E|nr:hypothetical protein [Pseudomonas composti]
MSQFVVHLTRNDTKDFSNGATAKENLISILKSRKIFAVRPHCIFNTEIKALGKTAVAKCRAACFTETPLSEIGKLARKIEGRAIELESYGLVFRKEDLIKAGGQPAIYINSYDRNNWLRESIRELFESAKANESSKLWRLIPYLNAMHEKYDFSWEREWRMHTDFKFKLTDIVCIILPENGENEIKDKAAKAGIAVISPSWTYEHIVYQLSSQQRKTKTITIDGELKSGKSEK